MACYNVTVSRLSQPAFVTTVAKGVHAVGVSRMSVAPTLLSERMGSAPSLSVRDENLHTAVNVSSAPQVNISIEEVCLSGNIQHAWRDDDPWVNSEPWDA